LEYPIVEVLNAFTLLEQEFAVLPGCKKFVALPG